jgi:hypothetical protein
MCAYQLFLSVKRPVDRDDIDARSFLGNLAVLSARPYRMPVHREPIFGNFDFSVKSP